MDGSTTLADMIENQIRLSHIGSIPALLPHLLEDIGQLDAGELLGILELEERIAAMPCAAHGSVRCN